MRLQLRVRHSLGARMLEVEAEESGNALACGRDRDADVQVPVGTVSPRHCLIWVDDGQWMIQDGNSNLGTYVNGQSIGNQPSVLRYGDVITLGQGAGSPTIEVDPQGVARRALRPAAARSAVPGTDAPPQIARYPDAPAEAPDVPPAFSVATGGEVFDQVEANAPDADEFVSLGGGAPARSYAYSASAPSRSRPRRVVRKQDSSMMIPWMLGGAAVIMLGGVLLYMAIRQDPIPTTPPKPKPAPVVEEDTGPRRKSNNIFDDTANQGKKTSDARTTNKAPAPIPQIIPAPQPEPQPKAETDPDTPKPANTDPGKQTDEWRAVESALSVGVHPGQAIWIFTEYLKNNPGKYEAEVKGYIGESLDRLWWQRIGDLQKKRDAVIDEIARIDADIAAATDPDFKKDRELEKKPLVNQRDSIIQGLTEDMGYDSKEVPNIADDVQVSKLRGARDKDKYEAWCKRVMDYVTTRRKLPWGTW